jgi:5'-3' exonuclease
LIALIDGDIVLYRTGFASQDVPENIAKARLSETMGMILDTLGTTKYQAFLSDSANNFRLKLFPNYKGNRSSEKPVHHEALRGYLLDKWKAKIAEGEEADDALGIRQCLVSEGDTDETTICSIDKDLMQIPGYHFNWVTGVKRFVTSTEARYRFWYQVLVGDSTDNITPKAGLSCPGIGPEKAYLALEGETTEADYFHAVEALYRNHMEDAPREVVQARLLLTGQLVKIRQYEGEIWQFPEGNS